ncbi:MAG TPA: acetate--CoA ligase family protein [Burkholderiales bacterium]|nr:acetate--CoA ligase family protein [Burkholderiales bacterium]
MSLAQTLFAPRAVALVGASGDANKNTARPQRFLARHGFAGRVLPINPTRAEVLGKRAYRSIAEAPQPIDHAFIMIPEVEQALEDCGRCGVPVASIFSDGFADAGEAGAARQARLAARARELGVRLLGPNSMGVIDLPGRLALTVNAVLEMDAPPAGGISMVSQSGTMLGTVLSRGAARGLGFAKLVSVGNEADLGVGELVGLLAEDPATRVILLFLETVRDAARLAEAARRAHAAGKPVVAYKLGRSVLGERLARSHTGALAGSDAAMDAFFRDCGIQRVDLLEALFEIAPLVEGRAPPRLGSAGRAPRVAVVTTTGGGAASVVDRLGLSGIETVAPGRDAPIIDLTMAGTSAQYAATLDSLLVSPDCDAVLAVVGSSAMFHPQHAVEPILHARRAAKPLATFLTPHADASLALLAKGGVAAFRTPEACADAFRAYFSWKEPREVPAGIEFDLPTRETKFNEKSALELFAALGIAVAESQVAHAPAFAHSVSYPVAAKILSTDIAHKTEAGGVVLDIFDANDFREKTKPLANLGGTILVQRMERGLVEAIAGYRDDPLVGPLVMVGAGGMLAELYRDTVVRLAPVSVAEAEEMVAEVKGLALVRGYRGLPRGDVRALAETVAALSRLALARGRPVAEAEINPVIVKRDGAVAVDGLVVLKG